MQNEEVHKITFKRIYNTYDNLIIKYASEDLITAARGKIDILERISNYYGAVKTTPIAAMQ